MADFVGPCVHGRDPWTRCDVCRTEDDARGLSRARFIVCSAIRHPATGIQVLGARHHNCIRKVAAIFDDEQWEQGFIDQDEKFLTREGAWVVAEAAGQIRHRAPGCDGPELYSENLY